MYATTLPPQSKAVVYASSQLSPSVGLRQLASATEELQELASRFAAYMEYCGDHVVPVLKPIADMLQAALTSAREMAEQKLAQSKALHSESEDWQIDCEYMARAALQTKSYVIQCLEWCAPAYLQSHANQFFDLVAQNNLRVNYERYESREVDAIEQQLQQLFGYEADRSVLVTSSGMAAYNVIESYLIRDTLKPGDTILVSPYIYFEASEQLKALQGFQILFSDSYDAQDMLAQIETLQPAVVFLDPLSNTPEQRVIDMRAFFERLDKVVRRKTTVVVDGTMIPGCFRKEWGHCRNVDVIYYESCSKYLQLGFDTTMAGYVLVPAAMRDRFYNIRRNTGSILARDCAHTFPRYDAETLSRRMDRITENALTVMNYFASSRAVQDIVSVHYPGHSSHIDYPISRQYTTLGGCVSFKFHADNGYGKLNRYIGELIQECARRNIKLIKGVSFGHTVPRISASSAMAGFDKPYVRLFVGALKSNSMLELCKTMEHVLVTGQYMQDEQ